MISSSPLPLVVDTSDQFSVTSTLTTDDFSKEPDQPQAAAGGAATTPTTTTPSTAAASSSNRRRVRFQDRAATRWYDNTTMSVEECRGHCWYQSQDYSEFKAQVLFIAKAIVRAEGNRPDIHESYTNTLQRLLEACEQDNQDNLSVLDESGQQQLHDLYHLHGGSLRVGLERMAVRRLYKHKTSSRQRLYEVLKIYQSAHPETLRTACRDVTRTSRLLARHMAQAQMTTTTTTMEEQQQQQN